jgi:hypothetical protein
MEMLLKNNVSKMRLLGLAALMSAACYASESSAFAAGGTIQNAKCGGASATFITLPPNETKRGFAASDKASQIVNGGSGKAGMVIKVDNSDRGQSYKGCWTNMESLVKVSENDLKNVKVIFCMDKSDKEVVLKDHVSRRPDKEGWRHFDINARSGGPYQSYVNYIKFVVPGRGNITVGHTTIGKLAAGTQQPADLITDDGDCSLLDSCGK